MIVSGEMILLKYLDSITIKYDGVRWSTSSFKEKEHNHRLEAKP